MTTLRRFKYFADNAWHDPAGGSWFESENPATGEVWAEVPDCRKADIDRAVAAAHTAFMTAPGGGCCLLNVAACCAVSVM